MRVVRGVEEWGKGGGKREKTNTKDVRKGHMKIYCFLNFIYMDR